MSSVKIPIKEPLVDSEGNYIVDDIGRKLMVVRSFQELEWKAPKTDWYGESDDNGNYTGDRFNVEDFNRIKNNFVFLKYAASENYKKFSIHDLGRDRVPSDYFYADEINKMEANLNIVSQNTVGLEFGSATEFIPNSNIFTYEDLNRLESSMLKLYERIVEDGKTQHRLAFRLGGGDL